MFEHMKNYKVLMSKIASWLRPKRNDKGDESLLFIHIFCHRTTPYHFEEGDGWMAKTFFTGGTMASHDLLVCSLLLVALRGISSCCSCISRTTSHSFRAGTSAVDITRRRANTGSRNRMQTPAKAWPSSNETR